MGARPVGKTTLANMLVQHYPESTWFFEDLNLESLTVIHPGDKRFPLGEKMWAVALKDAGKTGLIKQP